jgi:branched-chain amino acid transport system substrate-binding protein
MTRKFKLLNEVLGHLRREDSYMKWKTLTLCILLIIALLGMKIESGIAQAIKEIKIGVIQPLSGPLSQDGLINMKAYEFAVDEINNAGGIKSKGGAKIKILKGDSEGKPEVGMGEAERLISDGALVLMGAYQSSVTFTTSQVAERNQTPYICPISSAGAITKRGFKYLVKNSPDTDMYTVAALDFLKQMGERTGKKAKTIAIMFEDTLHGKELGDAFKRMAKDFNLEVTESIAYPHASPDLTAEISKVKASGSDVFMTITYVADAILITKTMNKLRYNPIAYFSYAGGANPQYAKSLGSLGEGTFTNAEWNHLLKKKGVSELNEKFKKHAGVNMDGFRAEIYTAVYVLKDALERASSLGKNNIMEALRKTNMSDHIMPYDRIVFDESGKNPNVKALIVEVKKGEYFPVYPFEFAAGNATWPFITWEKRGL